MVSLITMAKFILAEKKEMTQKFGKDGSVIPVTKVMAGPCIVIQVKTSEKDGYSAVQLGFGLKKNQSRPVKGHLKNLGNFRYLKEFKINQDQAENLAVGNPISAKIFVPGDIIKVTGISKGKGFQGVVKRHGFSGSPATHGHKDQLRMPGSIGAGGPQHVFKGTRMGGRMGGSQVTVKNLEVIEVDPEKNEIFIKGAVPGPRNNLLLLSGVGDIVIEQVVEEEAERPEENRIESKDQLAQPAKEVNEQSKPKASKEEKAAATTVMAAADQAAKRENEWLWLKPTFTIPPEKKLKRLN